jgi:hypothetical protein
MKEGCLKRAAFSFWGITSSQFLSVIKHLTPTPLLEERSYTNDNLILTPFSLRRRGQGDEVLKFRFLLLTLD